MTIIAGVYLKFNRPDILAGIAEQILANISRDPRHEIAQFRYDRCLLAKIDVGVFKAPAVVSDDRATTMLTGDPIGYLREQNPDRTRANDTTAIHEGLGRSDWSPLREARGSYCVARYDTQSHVLQLATDKLGIHRLYYYVNDEIVIFASALRIMEAFHGISRTIDILGVMQQVCCDLPMRGHTPFSQISSVRAGHVITFRDASVSGVPYWRWDEISESSAAPDELADAVYETFREAVSVRLGSDRSSVALLSGGLDSRCIVTTLRDLGARVHSFNFSPADTQDQIFARRFAQAVGSIHAEYLVAGSFGYLDPDLPELISEALTTSDAVQNAAIERPRLVWHGFDGDFTVGLVNMSKESIDLLRTGNLQQAVRAYIANRGMFSWGHFVRPASRRRFSLAHEAAMVETVKELGCAEPGKRLYVFHLLEEMVSDAHKYLERIDLDGVEFLYPFCDSRLIEIMMSVPIDHSLNHGLYIRFFDRFPEFARSVPWQTYPGAPPCPIPHDDDLPNQWAGSKQISRLKYLKGDEAMAALLKGGPLPTKILNPYVLKIMAILHRLRLGNYGYAFERSLALQHYWQLCDGVGERVCE